MIITWLTSFFAVNDLRPTAIDLFAGCGGLTRGLRDAGFHVAAAVEIDPIAAETYRWNNRSTCLIENDMSQYASAQDDLSAAGTETIALLSMVALPARDSVLMTSQHRSQDPRKELLMDDGSSGIEEIRPSAVMIENVPGIVNRGKQIFGKFLETLERLGYLTEDGWRVEQMADFGVPQSRRRLRALSWTRIQDSASQSIPHSITDERLSATPSVNTVRDTISHLEAPVPLSAARRNGGPDAYNWHLLRYFKPQT